MKHLIAIALISAAFSAPALAAEGSSCHFHGNQPVADTTVIDCAGQRKAQLVKSGKPDVSGKP